jgi:hypothetical protein
MTTPNEQHMKKLVEIAPTVALSIQQPWAWLIVHGWKLVENRSWPTNFRGPLWIHAGKKFDREGYDWIRSEFEIPMPYHGGFPSGGIVGRANLTGCVTEMDSPFFFGPYGFVLADASPVELVPCRGRLGFFAPDPDVLTYLRERGTQP